MLVSRHIDTAKLCCVQLDIWHQYIHNTVSRGRARTGHIDRIHKYYWSITDTGTNTCFFIVLHKLKNRLTSR